MLVQRTADQDNATLGVTVYVREPGGELLASFEPGAGATYYHFDALGSTVLLSDSSGNPGGAYAYGAWGDVLAAPGGWQPYQYVGQLGYYTHTASQGAEVADWLQLGVRFYSPRVGVFQSRDPIKATFRSMYSYGINPTNYVDPSGRACTPVGNPIKTGQKRTKTIRTDEPIWQLAEFRGNRVSEWAFSLLPNCQCKWSRTLRHTVIKKEYDEAKQRMSCMKQLNNGSWCRWNEWKFTAVGEGREIYKRVWADPVVIDRGRWGAPSSDIKYTNGTFDAFGMCQCPKPGDTFFKLPDRLY